MTDNKSSAVMTHVEYEEDKRNGECEYLKPTWPDVRFEQSRQAESLTDYRPASPSSTSVGPRSARARSQSSSIHDRAQEAVVDSLPHPGRVVAPARSPAGSPHFASAPTVGQSTGPPAHCPPRDPPQSCAAASPPSKRVGPRSARARSNSCAIVDRLKPRCLPSWSTRRRARHHTAWATADQPSTSLGRINLDRHRAPDRNGAECKLGPLRWSRDVIGRSCV
jgi:hypothetical protein